MLAAGLAGGCDTSDPELYRQIQAEDPDVRIQAIVRAGQTSDPKTLPYLVERLDDSERDVRMFAILALEKRTGKTMGYRYWQPREKRREAIDRWREWLRERNGGMGAATLPAGGEGA